MNRTRYLAHCCEQALSRGEPLHAALAGALAAVGGPSPRERAALDETLGGQIEAPLRQLGFEPLAARAAALSPERAAEVGRRLRSLPDAAHLSADALRPLRYVGLVLAVQIATASLLASFFLPSLVKMTSNFGGDLPFAARLAWLVLRPLGSGWVLLGLFALFVLVIRLLRMPARNFLWEATGARVCAAASALVGGGMEGTRAVGALAEAAPEVRARLEEFLRDGGLAAEGLRDGSEALIAQARARADRLRRVVWSTGMTVAILFAGCILTGAYGLVLAVGSLPFRLPQ